MKHPIFGRVWPGGKIVIQLCKWSKEVTLEGKPVACVCPSWVTTRIGQLEVPKLNTLRARWKRQDRQNVP